MVFPVLTVLQAQDPVDSLAIYDPFDDIDALRRIIKSEFTILGKKNQERVAALTREAEEWGESDPARGAQAWLTVGDLYFRAGIYNLALESYFKALSFFEKAGNRAYTAISNMKLGRTYYFSDLASPVDHFKLAGDIFKTLNDPKFEPYYFYLQSLTAESENSRARFIKKALNAQRALLRDKKGTVGDLELLATLLNADGNYTEAITIAETLPNRWLFVLILNNHGYDLVKKNDLKGALKVFERSLKICKEERFKTLLRNVYENIARVYRLEGDWKRSVYYMQLFKIISESLYLEQHSYQVSEMEVKYETARKALENDFLKKEREVLAESAATQRGLNILLILSICGVSLFTLVLVLGNRKLKKVNSLLDAQNSEIMRAQEDLQKLNEVLKKSEKDLNEAQAIAHLASWEMDPLTGALQFSEQFPEIVGLPSAELSREGFGPVLAKACHPESAEMLATFLGFRGPVSPESVIEFRVIREEETRWIRIKKRQISDKDGNTIRISGTVQDITEAKEEEVIRIKIAEQRSFTRKLITYQEEERKRLAGELHDGLGQDLLLIKNLALLGLQNPNADEQLSRQMDQISVTVSSVLDSIRKLSFDLRPAHIERIGLSEVIISAIERLRSVSPIVFTHNIESIEGLLSSGTGINLFRIVQESLSNAVKHSGATEVSVKLCREGNGISLTIMDNGRGFDPATILKTTGGFGLRNIINRVEMSRGSYGLISSPGEGATIQVFIPVEENG